jgi:GDP-4-dehydro-6-deoxy-D-mannose reductase
MRALVTGAGGFAGSHLVEYLLHQGAEVLALVRPGDDLAHLKPILGRLRVERGDIRDGERLIGVFRDTRPERIYHLAAVTSPADSIMNPHLTYEINLMGTLNLLEGIRQAGLDCRILFVSSSEVYGKVIDEDLPLREETALRPANPYSGSKAAEELLAYQFFRCYGVKVVRVRPFNHTGPRQPPAFVCSSLAKQVAEVDLRMRDALVRVGNLETLRDFTDVRDIVRGYYLPLEKGELGEVYQLCSGHPVSIDEILRILTNGVAPPIRVVFDPARVHARGPRAVWGLADKAARKVGWEPQFPLETTLRDLKNHWESVLRSDVGVKS